MSDAETLRRIPLEIFNDGRMELIDEFFAPDYIEHVAPPPGVPSGIDGLRVLVAALRTAFPDPMKERGLRSSWQSTLA